MKDQNYAATNTPQIRLAMRSPEYWRVTFDYPPLNGYAYMDAKKGPPPGARWRRRQRAQSHERVQRCLGIRDSNYNSMMPRFKPTVTA